MAQQQVFGPRGMDSRLHPSRTGVSGDFAGWPEAAVGGLAGDTPHDGRVVPHERAGRRPWWVRVTGVQLQAWDVRLLAALLLVYCVGLGWGLPSEFSPAVDNPVPYSPLAYAAEYGNSHVAAKYPAVHQIFLLPFYAVVIGLAALFGQLGTPSSAWPYGFTNPVQVMSILIALSGLVSVGMAAVVLTRLHAVRFDGYGAVGRRTAVLLIGGSGVFSYYAGIGNLDIPYLCWFGLAFGCLWHHMFNEPSSRRSLLLAAVCGGLAVGTKDQAAGLVLGLGLAVPLLTPKPWSGRFTDMVIFGAVSLLVYVVAAILPQPYRWLEHLDFWLSPVSGVSKDAKFEASLGGQLALLALAAECLINVLSPLGAALAAMGIVQLVRRRQYRVLAMILLPAIAYYVAILVPIRFVYERFLLPVAFLCALPAGVAATTIWDRLGELDVLGRRTTRTLAAALVVLGVVLRVGPVTYAQTFDMKRELARELDTYVPAGGRVLWAGGQTGLPNADVVRRFRLVLPDTAPAASRAFGHVFDKTASNAESAFVLSEKPLAEPGARLQLVKAWTYPGWVTSRVFVPCTKEYYLYRTADGRAVAGDLRWP